MLYNILLYIICIVHSCQLFFSPRKEIEQRLASLSLKTATRANFKAADCDSYLAAVVSWSFDATVAPLFVADYSKDVTGSQSRLCGRHRETGSGSLFRDSGTKLAPVARFVPCIDRFPVN